MTVDKPSDARGYPPVTRSERRLAEGRLMRDVRLTPRQKAIADAIAAVIKRHRAAVANDGGDASRRQFAMDLLDNVLLDVLQVVLDDSVLKDLASRGDQRS